MKDKVAVLRSSENNKVDVVLSEAEEKEKSTDKVNDNKNVEDTNQCSEKMFRTLKINKPRTNTSRLSDFSRGRVTET